MGQFENKQKATPIVGVSKKHPHKQIVEEEIVGLVRWCPPTRLKRSGSIYDLPIMHYREDVISYVCQAPC